MTMTRLLLLLCTLTCVSLACKDREWVFGKDHGDSVIIVILDGQISPSKRVTDIKYTVPPCMVVEYVQVTVHNIRDSIPDITVNENTNTVIISYPTAQPGGQTYEVVVKGILIIGCNSGDGTCIGNNGLQEQSTKPPIGFNWHNFYYSDKGNQFENNYANGINNGMGGMGGMAGSMGAGMVGGTDGYMGGGMGGGMDGGMSGGMGGAIGGGITGGMGGAIGGGIIGGMGGGSYGGLQSGMAGGSGGGITGSLDAGVKSGQDSNIYGGNDTGIKGNLNVGINGGVNNEDGFNGFNIGAEANGHIPRGARSAVEDRRYKYYWR